MTSLFAVDIRDSDDGDILDRFNYTIPLDSFLRFQKKTSTPLYHRNEGKVAIIEPAYGDTYEMDFIYYQPRRRKGKLPLLLILPPISGVNILDKHMARYFARRGYHVVITDIQDDLTDPERPLSDIDPFLQRTTSATMAIIDLMSKRADVDPEKVVAYGASLGGIRLLITMGVEPRIKAGVAYVAGGDMAEIMATSDVGIVANYRKAKMEELGLTTIEEYKEVVREEVHIDPLALSKYIDREQLLMTISLGDSGVPSKQQVKIWEALKKPLVDFVNLAHVPAVLTSFVGKYKMKYFYEKRLRIDSEERDKRQARDEELAGIE